MPSWEWKPSQQWSSSTRHLQVGLQCQGIARNVEKMFISCNQSISWHLLETFRNKILGQGDNFTGGAIRSLSDSPRTPTWNKFHKCLGSQPFPFRKWMCWSNSHSLSHLQHREPSIWNTKVQMHVYKKGVPEFSIRIWFNSCFLKCSSDVVLVS